MRLKYLKKNNMKCNLKIILYHKIIYTNKNKNKNKKFESDVLIFKINIKKLVIKLKYS